MSTIRSLIRSLSVAAVALSLALYAPLATTALPPTADYPTALRAALTAHITYTNKKLSTAKAEKIVDSAYLHANLSNLNPLLILGLIKAESHYNPTAHNSYGATGLMQVVPRFHKDKLKGRNPYDIETNISVGTLILSNCLSKHSHNLSLALHCYSGGAGSHYHAKIHSERSKLSDSVKATKALYAQLNQSAKTKAQHESKPKQYQSMQELLKDKNIQTAPQSQSTPKQPSKESKTSSTDSLYSLLESKGLIRAR